MSLLANSLNMLKGERRGASLYLWWISLAAAVAILFWFLALSQRIEVFLQRSTSGFLAADIVLSAPQPVDQSWLDDAHLRGLNSTQMLRFSTMMFAGDRLQLSSVKAVAHGYPLRGELRISDTIGSEGYWVTHGPEQGTVWLSETLALQLSVAVGERVEVGDTELTFSHYLLEQPDVAFGVFSSSPPSLIHLDDVARSGVIRPGSRVNYRYLFSGDSQRVDDWYRWLKQNKKERHTLTSLVDSESNLGDAYQRAQQVLFLAMVSALALTLIAMWSSLQSYAGPLTRRIGVLRILGASQRLLLAQFGLHLGITVFAGVAFGLLVGSGLDYMAAQQMASFAPLLAEQSIGVRPYLLAALSGVVACVCLLAPLLAYLFRVGPRQLLESAERAPKAPAVKGGVLLGVGFVLLTGLVSGWLNLLLMLGLIIVLTLLSSGVLLLVERIRVPAQMKTLHLAMLLLVRQRVRVTIQMVGLTLAIALTLAMVFVRSDLIDEWQRLVPEQTANFFLVNVNPDERTVLAQQITNQKGRLSGFYPIIRGRLTSINGEKVVDDRDGKVAIKEQQGRRRGINRELNLTWTDTLPEDNVIEAGDWQKTVNGEGLSVEEGMAKRLELELGDRLTFVVTGGEISLPITSIRSLDWKSMRPNFFVIFPKSSLDAYAHTYITSFYLPYESRDWLYTNMRQYPAVSLIDIEQILAKFAGYLVQIVQVVTVLVVLVLITALLVTASLVMGSFVRRHRELHIYRILGASDSALKRLLMAEFVLVGILAGVIASVIAEALLGAQALWIFEQSPRWHGQLWLLGPVVGMLATLPLAFWLTSRLLRASKSRVATH
ncbi:ABC transporter permease [Corallincola spongiicola]|uniref:FtsX-like permease family protein n=1 Tax=Corallincola spongiicola TaxID=2520508 RepID=A0ABY1WTC1_9GAMM|nr:FtsX-like permease family protein [Corallincola spongiicola]TAA47994.1 FtsX-like permease family protein [Corallincola spongiicola]